LTNLLDNQFEFLHQLSMQPSECDRLPYWKFEAFVERLNKKNDEERAQNKKQQEEYKKQQSNSGMGKYNPSSFLNKLKR